MFVLFDFLLLICFWFVRKFGFFCENLTNKSQILILISNIYFSGFCKVCQAPIIHPIGNQKKKKQMSNKKSNSTNMTTFNEADRRKILESLTADELATFQEAFTVFDKNQDGTITTKVSTPTNSYFYTTYQNNLIRFDFSWKQVLI